MNKTLKKPIESELDQIICDINSKAFSCKTIVFIQGDFNILHPGHIRFINFAASCGDFLIVGVNSDEYGHSFIPENNRLASIQALDNVSYSFILREPVENFLLKLKPNIVVKGKEFSQQSNSEKAIVESYGGQLLFSSGEVKFSSINLLKKEFSEINFSSITKPEDFLYRHNFSTKELLSILDKFSSLNVVVIGDLIIDKYITCDPIGMSQEDPTIVVRPIKEDCFIGGSAIVAAHAQKMGAHVSFFTVADNDEHSKFAQQKLEEYGVTSHILLDKTRPTTVKKRYQASKKTLLRINHIRDHEISNELIQKQLELIKPALDKANLLIFSDFNYGALPQALVHTITNYCREHNVMMVADSQSSSQLGDISRYKHMTLVTPTEREARIALQDFKSGIVTLADNLMKKTDVSHVLLTLGEEGVLICNSISENDKELRTDRLPAFNTMPRDVAGAGDSLLTCASMAFSISGDIWQSSYMGSIAAACQVSRVGNTPITYEEIKTEILL